MPKKTDKKPKKRTTRRVTETVEEPQLDEIEEPSGREIEVETLDPDVERVLAELGPSVASVYIQRRDPVDRQWSFVEKWPADQFSIQALRDKYGGGQYQARFLDPQGEYMRARDFRIEGPPRTPKPESEQAPAQEQTGMLFLLREILDAVKRPQEAGAASGKDALDTAIKMVELMQLQTKPFMDALVALRTGGGGGGAGGAESESGLDVLERGIELGERLAAVSGGDEGTVVGQLAREVIGVLRESKQRDREKAAIPAPKAPGVPALGEGAPAWARRFGPYLPVVVAMAADDRDPELYTDLILDRLDGSAVAFITEQLSTRRAEFQNEFYHWFPHTAQYREWFDGMFAVLADRLVGPSPDERLEEIETAREEDHDLTVGGAAQGDDAVPGADPTR